MKLSVVIPARNEQDCLEDTVRAIQKTLLTEKIEHEILLINDHSTDDTEAAMRKLTSDLPSVRYLNNPGAAGFGLAVKVGLYDFAGDAVAICMGDASEDPQDLVTFYRTLIEEDVDCVFGSRFVDGGSAFDYPLPKLILNRLANHWIMMMFGLRYNDMTNAFKMYRRSVIEGVKPILSHHFNITVELPLKAVIRGYTYRVIPNQWTNRKAGHSKLKIEEMGSRYLFIVLYCLIEKWLSHGDYRRQSPNASSVREHDERTAVVK